MFTVASNALEIKLAQKRFRQAILSLLDNKDSAFVGYQGGSHKKIFYWSPKLLMWAILGKASNRFWNAFGLLDKPKLPKLNSIEKQCFS